MKITIEEARKIALLSRLEFSAEDLEKMRESMNSILTHMEELNQHDTEGVEPTAHAVEQYNVMREDEPHQSLSNEEALLMRRKKKAVILKCLKLYRRYSGGIYNSWSS